MKEQALAAVAREYFALPASDVSWPNPHPDRRSVLDEEYSRVTNPPRYRIVGARAIAWERALVGLGLATVEPAEVPGRWFVPRAATASRLVPTTVGALPLIVVRGEVQGTPDAVITVGVGAREPIYLGMEPDCGCDACDSGSADLLAAIDERYLTVVAGNFVHATGRGWSAHTNHNGWEGNGRTPAGIELTFSNALAGRPVKVPVITGTAWWPV
ncbi:DUF6226 family protein [Gryllotalpicola reticulitermitis]|uniref:DUF6226 family protein n=1 Tax=Gryllotalpicola reticulitermitis TaxID=1184153 RepID=A0ABV8Q2Y0_9MICO